MGQVRGRSASISTAIALVCCFVANASAATCPAGSDKTMAAGHGAPTNLDGVLDDPIWASACWITEFEQQQPRYRDPPKHPLKIAIAITADTLYVAARLWSANRDDISDALTIRDDLSQAERIIVSVDPSRTRRIAYSFAVSAAGVRQDWIHTDDTQGSRDQTWNPVWDARTQLLADGWSAEIAMPLSQLRLPTKALPSWGINFNWYIPHRNEDVFWRAVDPSQQAWASIFGELVDLPPIEHQVTLELLPFLAGRISTGDEIDAGFEAGLDLRLRPKAGLVMTASLNPDFGQVDVDPAFVNLSAFEVTLTERRPFFVENNALFSNNPANFFYSRRIGALPRSLPAADSIDLPNQARILGALAVGGYLASRTQVAALAAVTDNVEADAIVDGAPARVAIAPLAAWSAVRVEQQLGRSVIGATATMVHRDVDDPGLAARLPSNAIVAAADALIRSCDGTYELAAFAGGSVVNGSREAITAIQRSSTHFFQRPDAGHLAVDPEATMLAGYTAGLFGARRTGAWRYELGGYAESPGYETNDMGLIRSTDDLVLDASATYLDAVPTARVNSWNVNAGASQEWNYAGDRKPALLYGSGGVTFANFASASVEGRFSTPGISDDLTRGGPRMAVGWAAHAAASASTRRDSARQLTVTVSGDVSPTLVQGIGARASLIARLTPAIRFDLTPSLTVVRDRRQFVGAVDDRYLFGHLSRAEAALELRATLSLTPNLVVTLFAQPFASVGKYRSLGELAAAGSAELRTYDAFTRDGAGMREIVDGMERFTIPEPDYEIVSLRSTAVLRYEIRPGSVLFLVWQQARAGATAMASPLSDAIPDIFRANGIHTFAAKLSYWFG